MEETRLEIRQGTEWARRIVLTNNGTPIDLTGATAKMQFRTTAASDRVVLELSTDTDGGVYVHGEEGTLLLFVPKSKLATVRDYSGVYDLKLTYPEGGRTIDVIAGRFTIIPTVTR